MSNNAVQADIAIVGGGMVGLSLALMLAKKKLPGRILLFDEQALTTDSSKNFQPSFDDRSTAISAGSLGLLKELDLWSDIETHAQAIDTVKISDKNQIGFTQYSSVENNHRPLGYVIENRCLGEQLIQAVKREKRIDVKAPASVENVRHLRECVELTINHINHINPHSDDKHKKDANKKDSKKENNKPQKINVSLLILADGANSTLAQQMGIEFENHEYNQHALIANVRHAEAHDGIAFEHFTEHGPLALLPLSTLEGQHRSALVWTQPSSSIDAALSCSDEDFITKLQQQFAYRLGEIVSVGQRQAYPLCLSLAKEQIRRRLVLVGNAAHFLHPVAGQGFNLALRDSSILANCLADGAKHNRRMGDLIDLQNYLENRASDQWLTIALSDNFISLFANSNLSKRLFRTTALSLLNKLPPAKSLFFQQMMGQGIHGVSLR